MLSSEIRTNEESDDRSPPTSVPEKRLSELRLPEDGPQVRGRSSTTCEGASFRTELSHVDLLVAVERGVVLRLDAWLRSWTGEEKFTLLGCASPAVGVDGSTGTGGYAWAKDGCEAEPMLGLLTCDLKNVGV